MRWRRQIGLTLKDREARQRRRLIRYAFLAARDGRGCWLCGREVDVSRASPDDPMRLSFDHYVPRSRGGSDDLVNLRLAHAKCNSDRGSGAECEA